MALAETYLGTYSGADTLADTYRASYDAGSTLASGYDNVLALAPAVGGRPLSLPSPGNLRGRENVAIPAAGVVLPAARNGTGPYAYSISGLPSGVSFNASTRALTGTPSAAATATVSYTVTDSATPAAMATRTFTFTVADIGDEVTLADWDNRGYGLSTLTPVVLALFESDTAVAGTEGTVAIFARQNRGNAGHLLDADGVVTTDLSSLTLPNGGVATPIINWIRLHPNNGRITFNQSGMDAMGVATPEYAFSSHFLDGTTLYLQDKLGVVEIPRDNAGGGFMRFRPTAGQNEVDSENLMARLDAGVHFIVALTLP